MSSSTESAGGRRYGAPDTTTTPMRERLDQALDYGTRLDAADEAGLDAVLEHFNIEPTDNRRADALAACVASGLRADSLTSNGERLDARSVHFLAARAISRHRRQVGANTRQDSTEERNDAAPASHEPSARSRYLARRQLQHVPDSELESQERRERAINRLAKELD